MTGFCLLVSPTCKSWQVRKRLGCFSLAERQLTAQRSRVLTITLGRYPALHPDDARRLAIQVIGRVSFGENPQDKKKDARLKKATLDELFFDYMEIHAKVKNKSWKNTQEYYRRYLSEKFGRLEAASIKRPAVNEWFVDVALNHGKPTANRALIVLQAVLNWALVTERLIAANPCYGIKKFRQASRERFLHPGEEYNSFLDAVAQEKNESARDALFLLLYTGQRLSSVLTMRWVDIDLHLRIWRIPETKNGESHTVCLDDDAIKILGNRKHTKEAVFVFPGNQNGHVNPKYLRRAFKRVKQCADISDLRIHDLRRTLGSLMACSGASTLVIGKALGHRDPRSTAIYARLGLDEVRKGMEIAKLYGLGSTKS